MRALLFLLTALWFIGGMYFCNKTFCKAGSKAKTAAVAPVGAAGGGCDASLSVTSGDFTKRTKTNFEFKGGDISLLNPKALSPDFLNGVRTFLTDTENSSLLVEGIYSNKETNDTGKDNLGVARAMVIKDFLINNYKFNEDQVKIGSMAERYCFDNKTNRLKNGARFTLTVK